ncbi:AMP-binding protein [Paenibacillus pasadenensis]|nr:AMP-binding protein [Paenibacillus pasadenensis]
MISEGWFERRCRISAGRIAVMDESGGCRLTYRELEARSKAAAALLVRLGIASGDRIAVLCPNDVRMLILLFACRLTGAVLVPLNRRLHERELRQIVGDCAPKLIWHQEGGSGPWSGSAGNVGSIGSAARADGCDGAGPCWLPLSRLDEAEEEAAAETSPQSFGSPAPSPAAASPAGSGDDAAEAAAAASRGERQDDSDRPWLIIYTGGTTGQPKGVVLTARSLYWNALNTVASWQLTERDITPTVLPMFHTGGLNALTLPVLMAGGKVICVEAFHPERMIDLLEREGCTIVLMVPTMYHLLVECPRFASADFSRMSAFLSGGAPCPLRIYEAFASRGLPFKEGYGATESGPNNFFISAAEARRKPGSVGLPMLFTDMRLAAADGRDAAAGEVGELLLRGRHLFHSYWGNESATAEALQDGWFHTGDLARADRDGYCYIVGRKRDMIITGGENVYPLEVEQLLERHPEVGSAAVVGIPHPKWGEAVAAAVVPKPGCRPSERSLQLFCADSIAGYKVPKRIVLLEELPKTAVGKLDKKTLVPLFGPPEAG